MNKLKSILRKNLLVLIKSRWWMLVVIIAPLLIIFLSGIAFDNLNEYRLNIGIYSPTYNELTTSFISKLNTDEFRTIKALTEAECIDFIKLGVSHACIIFPPDLVLGALDKELVIFIDYSKLNLAWVVRDMLFSKVGERSTEITQQLTENLLSKLLIVRDEISKDIPVIAMISDGEENITNIAKDTFLVVRNTSNRVNKVDVDKLELSVNFSINQYWKLEKKAQDNLKFALFLIVNGDFDDYQDTKHTADVNKRKTEISVLNSQIKWLYSPDYSYSINNTLKNIRLKTNTSNMVISLSETSLNDILRIVDLNKKLVRRVQYSAEYLGKELDNVEIFSAEDIAAPVALNIKPITSYNTNLNYIFPTLMALSIMLASLLLSSIIVVMELNSPAFFRNVISPTRKTLFFFSTYLTNISVVGFQIALMIIMSMFFFFSQVISSIFSTLFVCLLIATFFIVLGMGIGHLFKTEHISILAATFTASIFLFLSNILVPIENMPLFLTKIVQFNPFIISVSLIRKVILFDAGFFAIATEVTYLLLLTVLLLLIYYGIHYTKNSIAVIKR